MTQSQTSAAWQRIGEQLRLGERLAAGEAVAITADEIKALGGREPRLMTKFDTRESRPPELAGATILPVTNGAYVVLPGDGYHEHEATAPVRAWKLPDAAWGLRTLPWKAGVASESQALDMALAAGILQRFLEEDRLCLTIRGRLRAPPFDFVFDAQNGPVRLAAQGVQVEVDAGLEGGKIHLVEAKLGVRGNFHVRQVYYPWRMWGALVPDKEVSTVFLTWSNRRFTLRRYTFHPVDGYHAIRLVAAADYLVDEEPEPPALGDVLARARPAPLPAGVPFPQADDVRKVVDVVDAVAAGCATPGEIAERYDFVGRQGDYYANAAVFLDYVERSRHGFALTAAGQRFANGSLHERTRLLLERLASLPVFREALASACERGRLPHRDAVAEWIAANGALTGTTLGRRTGTVLSWTQWALETTRPKVQLALPV